MKFIVDGVQVDFGAAGDLVKDDTDALNAATASGASIIELPRPPVGYKITGPILVRNSQTLRGHGTQGEGSGICNYGNSDAIRSFSAPYRYVVLKDINIVDMIRETRTAGHAINMRGKGSGIFRISRGYVTGHMDGFHIEGGMASSLADARSDSAKNDAFSFTNPSTSIAVSNTYADSPGRYGYYGTLLNYSTFSATACDASGSDAYHFEGTRQGKPVGVTLLSPGCEAIKGNGMYIADSLSFTIISPQLAGVPIGKSVLVLERPSNMTILSPYLRGGDYGIRVLSDGVITSKSVFVMNPLYVQNALGPVSDPLKVLQLK